MKRGEIRGVVRKTTLEARNECPMTFLSPCDKAKLDGGCAKWPLANDKKWNELEEFFPSRTHFSCVPSSFLGRVVCMNGARVLE